MNQNPDSNTQLYASKIRPFSPKDLIMIAYLLSVLKKKAPSLIQLPLQGRSLTGKLLLWTIF